ncbi:MAG: hypothetical protein SLAVMIC_00563 [uncultured marine phage]|uniref:Uncharacterized protein n=1 Tax=uncultured marine phage TaxID=707152 RepID=A0A8D9CD99_9VIRU|nr:MAG: hypothetical protein SLAVMIC_00563 [uncultured marine phage]
MKHLKTFENYTIILKDCDSDRYEYQFRDIDSGVYYKRSIGEEVWSFTNEEDFNNNATKDNTIEWENKEEK